MNIRIAKELIALAQELLDYHKATEDFGGVVKKIFRGMPWQYDNRAKAWVISGESNVERFFERYNHIDRDGIRRKLGGKFNGYIILADIDDSYILVTLD